jgi:hypothetical protein
VYAGARIGKLDEYNVLRSANGNPLGFLSSNMALHNVVGDMLGIISPSKKVLDMEGNEMTSLVMSAHGSAFGTDGTYKGQAVGIPPPIGLLRNNSLDAGMVLWKGSQVCFLEIMHQRSLLKVLKVQCMKCKA